MVQEQKRVAEFSKSLSPSSSAPTTLPPPILLHSSDTSMIFKPSPFLEQTLQQRVAYYKLFGRSSTGNNIKVRFTDKHFPGLGMEVKIHGHSVLKVIAYISGIVHALLCYFNTIHSFSHPGCC